ncbi:MAG TPA: ABC transporter permease [Candidatus Binatia bacterium]|nr:ABC transporter permease [Candidatus Binatia bacterium]
MQTFWQDIRYAIRMLAKNPWFTLIAVLTIALGIGANTAIFTVVDAVMIRSLPVADPQRLVTLTDPDSHGHTFGSDTGELSLLSWAEYSYLRDRNDVFSSIFAADSSFTDAEVTVGGSAPGVSASTETALAQLVSGAFFSTFGVQPAAGRLFSPEMDRAHGGAPYAVISYEYWKQRFGLNPSALGSTLRIHGTAFEIIGVTPPGFFGDTVGDAPQVWLPIMMQGAVYPGRDYLDATPAVVNIHMWLHVMARLKPGVTLDQARTHINVQFKQYVESALSRSASERDRKHALDQYLNLRPGGRGSSTLHGSFGDPLKVLMALVGLVLLIACANIANLLLARGAVRQKEFAVRMAIGAGRTRLIRQLLTESLLIALLGAVAGVMLAQWADALLLHLASRGSFVGSPVIQLDLQPDPRVLAFTLALATLTAILFGLFPALRAARLNLAPVLKAASSSPGGAEAHRRLPAGKILVIAQVAVSLVLLVAAGLFLRSLGKLSEVNLGYDRENLLLFRVDAAPGGYKGDSVLRVHQEILDKIVAIPGVRVATLSSNGLFQHSESVDPVTIEGYKPKAGEEVEPRMDHIGPGYFSSLGIPVLAGREIGRQDTAAAPRVAVVNQAFAQTYFHDSSPVGKIVRDTYPGNPGEAEIVGVVADVKSNSLRERVRPRVYLPFFHPMWEHTSAGYMVRTFADPASVTRAIRKTVEDTNPAFSRVTVTTMQSLVDQSLNTDAFIARLSSAFGALALLLACIGLYGLMAYNVARRTRDIGIRMALGAQPRGILRGVLRETLLLVGLGIAVGVPVALGGARLIQSLLFGVGLADPLAMLCAIVVLAGVAALAGYLPARRAARVDPLIALRYE